MSIPTSAGPTWDVATVLPLSTGRFWIYLIIRAIKFYNRHEAQIAPHLSDDLQTAMNVLTAAIPFLSLLNVPGPR